MREGMPLIFGWKVDFVKHPSGHCLTDGNGDQMGEYLRKSCPLKESFKYSPERSIIR